MAVKQPIKACVFSANYILCNIGAVEDAMRSVTATEFARNFAAIQEDVRHESAIAVTSHGRPKGYFLSPDAYAEYEELRAKARRILPVGRLSETTLRALRRTTMDERHRPLDALMDD